MRNTLVTVMRSRAEQMPESLACAFLVDGEQEMRTISYAGLDREARRVASLISGQVALGARVILVYQPGLDFLIAFLGCLYAGVIAIPVYPPRQPRFDGLNRLKRILDDSGADALLTTYAIRALADTVPAVKDTLAGVRWIQTDGGRGDASDWRDPDANSDGIAFIQYTSGSTTDPKGVVLRHENLIANLEAIHWFVRQPDHGKMVSWLPMYHDMGLIGTVLYPLFQGIPTYLMSPSHFLQRPVRWLRLISRVCGTITGAPSFAYELCVQRVTDEDRSTLDLSSWEVGFNGSEPIRAATIRRFERAFSSCGLRAGTVVGCYGLAEATLLVTGAHREDHTRFVSMDREQLERGIVRACPHDDALSTELVSCGSLFSTHEIRIVDPKAAFELPPGTVGEIWLHSPAVAQAYWNRPEESALSFGAILPNSGAWIKRYLRTGDLGFMLDGQLYVTGRLKDLLIIRGRNIHPHDVEDAVQSVDSRLRVGRGVAFPVETEDGEGIGLVQETTETQPDQLGLLVQSLREAVVETLQTNLAVVYLVAPRSVSKTSSGKLSRRATHAALRAGQISILYEHWDVARKLEGLAV